jgi:hypothetical protein
MSHDENTTDSELKEFVDLQSEINFHNTKLIEHLRAQIVRQDNALKLRRTQIRVILNDRKCQNPSNLELFNLYESQIVELLAGK